MNILEETARDHLCPFANFEPCKGRWCMAWVWTNPAYEHAVTNNLVQTDGGLRPSDRLPEPPEGDGWERDGDHYLTGYANSTKDKLPKATAQRWRRRLPRRNGQCGRVPAGDPYHGPYPVDEQVPF